MELLSEIRLAPRGGARPLLSSVHEHLLSVRHEVDAEGGAAIFDLAFTNQKPFRLEVPAGGMPAIFAEIRHAQALLLHRQRIHLDRRDERLLELCEAALRVAHIDVLIDPRNGDRLIVHHFHDHGPIVFRVSPIEALANIEKFRANIYQLSH